jgi:uncharacterized membrane protein YuzA (DUF378 family)
MNVYGIYTIRMILVALVIFGGINWGLHAFKMNLVMLLAKNFKKNGIYLEKIIYLLVAFSAILLAFQRDTWLPFLGKSVLPDVVVPQKPHTGDSSVTVQVSPNAKVAYWSAKPGDNPDTDVVSAYGDYANSGVAIADSKGNAVLHFDKGTDYVVPSGKHIKSHVHYREVTGEYGLMGPINVVYM